ncbi:MAG: YHS domain-containing protein [Candidatus Aminicenantales bacterium]
MKQSRLLALLGVVAFILVLAVAAQQKSDDKAVDPVCGMTVVKAKAAATYEYKGTTYYFCGMGCKDAFVKGPDKYIKKSGEKEPGDVLMPKTPMTGHHMGPGQMGERMPMGPGGGQMMGRMMAGPMGSGMNRLLLRRDVEWSFTKTADGVTVKIASKDPETVKAIQERLAMMKEMKETMAAPAEAGAAFTCSCPNCQMKGPVKK